MSDIQRFLLRLGSHIWDRTYRTEVEEEVLDHLQCAIAELEEAGVESTEARRRAVAAFGDPEAIGRLLQKTERGGRTMRMVQFAGVSSLIAGALAALFLRETALRYKIERWLGQYVPALEGVVFLLCITLFYLALIGFMLRHAQSRTDRILLLASPVLSVASFLAGGVALAGWDGGWTFMMLGLFLTGIGLTVAGIVLVRRHQNLLRPLGLIMMVTGLLPLLLPFLGPYAADRTVLGALVAYGFSTGWLTLGVALLSNPGDSPPRQVA